MSWYGTHPVMTRAEAKALLPVGACRSWRVCNHDSKSASDVGVPAFVIPISSLEKPHITNQERNDMPSVNDWAARAARFILDQEKPDAERIAAIIEIYARPLLDVLRAMESRGHRHVPGDSYYCCPRCDHSDHSLEEGEVIEPEGKCKCGFDELQQRFQKAISGPNTKDWP